MKRFSNSLPAVSIAAVLVAGCAADSGGGSSGGDTDSTNDCSPDGATTCQGSDFMVCENGDWTLEATCAGETPICDPEWGCVVCVPGESYCEGSTVMQCAADGSSGEVVEECAANENCVDGQCVNLCDEAAENKSYMGCNFISLTTSNSLLAADFDNDFAVIIGNPQDDLSAEVTVSRAGGTVATDTVAPGDTKAIMLPMVSELKAAQESVVAIGAAYEVETSVPVIAYQYNPLHYEGTADFSYTNDASLLLPEHTLTGEYIAVTWPTWSHGSWQMMMGNVTGSWSAWYPGFIAAAAVEDGTEVTITSAGYTSQGEPPAMVPGESRVVTLDRGDVVQLYSMIPSQTATQQELQDVDYCQNQGWDQTSEGTCPPEGIMQTCEGYCSCTWGDLTGTRVSATGPLAVFSGHMCTFIPYYSWACDHLEEMLLPLETWGESEVMTALRHPDPDQDSVVPSKYRVMSGGAGVELTFTPEVHETVTLGTGQYVEFETDQDFLVEGTGQFYVTQTMLGQDELGSDAGDPAMGTGIPLFQARGAYNILVPDSYVSNYVNVVAPSDVNVSLDGTDLGGWEQVASSGYKVARQPILPGAHTLESEGGVGFGITSYGYASYTSYLYPGGMNLESFVE